MLGVASCKAKEPTEPVFSDPATAVFAPETGVNLAAMRRTTSGLYIQDVTVGTGAAAAPSNRVTVNYVGMLPSGREFDRSSSGPVRFSLDSVIDGFGEGLVAMRVGGLRKLVIPPELGYGANPPSGSRIPANSVLIFDVQLVSIP
jgi:FKBP-type peptidyl-prolyl cis-trans isomerase